MALSINSSGSNSLDSQTSGSGVTISVTNFTASAGTLIVAVFAAYPGGPSNLNSPVFSGGGGNITWANSGSPDINQSSGDSSGGTVAIGHGKADNTLSNVTITCTFNAAVTWSAMLAVYAISNAVTTSIGATAGTTDTTSPLTVTISGMAATSWAVGGIFEFVGVGTITQDGNTTIDFQHLDTGNSSHVAMHSAADGNATIGGTCGGSPSAWLAAIEVKAAAGAPTKTPDPVTPEVFLRTVWAPERTMSVTPVVIPNKAPQVITWTVM